MRAMICTPMFVLVAVGCSAAFLQAQTREDAVVNKAILSLEQFMALPEKRIPRRMLHNAQAVAIIPNVVKGGFVVGIRHGCGVFVTRLPNGSFRAPQFVSLTGGSIGFQAGVQSTDVILVFRTAHSIQQLMQGSFTLGIDAAAAAGPIGRQAAAATDLQLQAEVWSYSRSRGAFVGVSLDGSVLQLDSYADQLYYRTPTGQPATSWPPSAVRLIDVLGQYMGSTTNTEIAPPTVASVPTDEVLRGQLAAAALHLYARLPDEDWRQYLALPNTIYYENQKPDSQSLQDALAHFDTVAKSPQYQTLTHESDFQQVYGLLKGYAASQAPTGLLLPPPPVKAPPKNVPAG